MEAFLSTLPPYVHEFLDKYPPTDVFNLLKELICFAVLYSDDRARINQSTEEFLKKREQQLQDQQDQDEVKPLEEEAVVPEPNYATIESITEETEAEIKSLEESRPIYNIRTGEIIHTDNSKMPNTFPEWWGHHEAELVRKPAEPVVRKTVELPTENNDAKAQSVGPVWISWENSTADNTVKQTNNHRLERARSQIIPNLRSYLEDDKKTTGSRTAPNSASTATKKRHSMLDLKTSTTPAPKPLSKLSTSLSSTPPPQPRVKSLRSSAPVCAAPVLTQEPKPMQKTARRTTTKEPLADAPPKRTTPARSASLSISHPRPNAAMRARAEHARIQQEELERKKNAPAAKTPASSLRIKQRANSGIDWSAVKQGRRNTISEPPKSE